jgi:hypothetical protein
MIVVTYWLTGDIKKAFLLLGTYLGLGSDIIRKDTINESRCES